MAPNRTVIDFDHHSAAYAVDPAATAHELARTCPVAWTEAHGGYWVVSGYSELHDVARNPDLFRSRHDIPTGSTAFEGVNLPGTPTSHPPIETDAPAQLAWRQALGPYFSPAAVERMKPLMSEFATWCLDQQIETGDIDFVMDLGAVVPTLVTLHLLGVPLSRAAAFAELTHKVNYVYGPEMATTFHDWDAMLQQAVDIALRRRTEPRDDVLTVLATMRIDGELLTYDEILGACGTIVAGGIDTTAATMACALKHLGENPELRTLLNSQRELLPAAVEEFVRYISPIQGLSRTCASDTVIGDQQIRAGDRVLLLFQGANMDERQFAQPLELDIARTPNKHLAFGQGPHRCIGAGLARADIPIMLEAVLDRMPDYRLVPGAAVRYPSVGLSNNYISLPATFTPGRQVGVREELARQLALVPVDGS